MDILENFVQSSVGLYNFLGDIPNNEERDRFIKKILELVDERYNLAISLKEKNVNPFIDGEMPEVMKELNEGIIQRLKEIQKLIEQDLKKIHSSKKNEIKYIDPYGKANYNHGIYFDNKK